MNLVFTKTEASLGIKFKLNCTWSASKATTTGLGTTVETRGNVDAPDTYSEYTYLTFQLNPSAKRYADFYEQLVTPDWPKPGTPERSQNTALKDALVPPGGSDGPAVWKVCYVLTDSHKTSATAGQAAKAETSVR